MYTFGAVLGRTMYTSEMSEQSKLLVICWLVDVRLRS